MKYYKPNKNFKEYRKLGLTNEQARVYSFILKKGVTTAQDIAKFVGIPHNSVYRNFYYLENLGLLARIDGRPMSYMAVNKAEPISSLASAEISRIAQIVDTDKSPSISESVGMKLLNGQNQVLQAYSEFAKTAISEILVISVGEEVPSHVWKSTRTALDNDVDVKFIFHENSSKNRVLINKWLLLGVNVRHVSSAGYHLFIFDSKTAILSASNIENSKERSGTVIRSSVIVQLLRSYFYQQWSISESVKNKNPSQ